VSHPEARQPHSRWREGVALLPSVGLAVASKFTCSLCVAGYAGVLSSFGVGFVGTDRGLTVLTVILLVLGLASLGWSWRSHRHPGPLSVSGIGAMLLIVGRLTRSLPLVLHAGAGLVLAGSLWNLWLGWRRSPDLVLLRGLGRRNP
jgi:MerC mercury resistance protein